MKNYTKALAIVWLFGFFEPCFAQDSPKGKFDVQPYVAYNQTNLKWSIAGNKEGKNPNVLSELEWEKLKGPQFGLNLKYGITNKLITKLDFAMMDITSGRVTDTDYSQDDRQGIFYQEFFKANKGTDLSLALAIGYTLYSTPGISISPFLGYDFRKQKVFLLGREGVAAEQLLKSSYQNNWQGIILGTDLNLQTQKLKYHISLSASLLDYNAKANWNLIEEFAKPVSFKHQANAFSLRGQLKVIYTLSQKFGLALHFGSIYAKAFKGTDEAYYVSRSAVQTQLNGVKSFGYSAGVGFSYHF
ncbi:hypothetical protein [Pedobacter sp. Hv1]|uniref:hypothetical protein n=1 Tax=Pedobacter sp. Hv1 TaxID=1740090 RepID=UPI0006D8AD2B|nr:hypothetical protein [Pedobacter sp. Hv1]KQB98963.1 hypothetical protein AQF98_19735 [Pedobacter sp. Hv1]